jgi:hypothetical protein
VRQDVTAPLGLPSAGGRVSRAQARPNPDEIPLN